MSLCVIWICVIRYNLVMSTSGQGRRIHGQAEEAREKGDFVEALKFTDEAMAEYVEDGDILGFAEVLQSRVLTARHLADKTGSELWLRYAVHAAMAGVEAAERSGDKSSVVLPCHTVGKTYESLGEYEEALSWHERAVESKDDLPERHNRDGFKAEMMAHLSFCQMMTGDESGYERLLEAISLLETSDEVRYNKDVWLSGMHMSAAEALVKLGRKDEAELHMGKADEIIKANPELVLRKEQWKRLRERL